MALIEDLLKYTREISLKELSTPVNISETAQKVLTLLDPENKMDVNFINLNQNIIFKPIALQQIIQNLISNSIKYNNKEKTKIVIAFDDVKKELSISDNGPGIQIKYQEKVFEFFQTLGNKSNGDSGTGLGLTIVKKLVEKNQAEIFINPYYTGGVQFVISKLVLA